MDKKPKGFVTCDFCQSIEPASDILSYPRNVGQGLSGPGMYLRVCAGCYRYLNESETGNTEIDIKIDTREPWRDWEDSDDQVVCADCGKQGIAQDFTLLDNCFVCPQCIGGLLQHLYDLDATSIPNDADNDTKTGTITGHKVECANCKSAGDSLDYSRVKDLYYCAVCFDKKAAVIVFLQESKEVDG